jgi:hypothetical protein
VIEERNARGDAGRSAAINREFDEYIRFTGFAMNLGVACFAHKGRWEFLTELTKLPNWEEGGFLTGKHEIMKYMKKAGKIFR